MMHTLGFVNSTGKRRGRGLVITKLTPVQVDQFIKDSQRYHKQIIPQSKDIASFEPETLKFLKINIENVCYFIFYIFYISKLYFHLIYIILL